MLSPFLTKLDSASSRLHFGQFLINCNLFQFVYAKW
jgi:hypothetical protein